MASIKYFDIMRDVINTSIKSIADMRGISLEEAYSEVVSYLIKNSGEWNSGRQPNINYKDPLCRIAYLYGIVPANANLLEFVFEWDHELEAYMDKIQTENGEVGICAFGGGPGTELLGLAKRIETRVRIGRNKDQTSLNFLLLDQVNEWMDSWYSIQREINSRFKRSFGPRKNNWPLITSGNSCSVDVTHTEHFGNWGAVFDKDIYIFSYIISEVFDNHNQLQDFVTKMSTQAPDGSKFLFIDRWGQKWKDNVKDTAEKSGINLSGFHDTNDFRHYMSNDEQKTDLGKIYIDVGRSPRTTWNAFWAVGTKES